MKPGDFLLGVLDFFAILLPGSLAAWLLMRYVDQDYLGRTLAFGPDAAAKPEPLVLGLTFLLVAYVLGHFVFMMGSRLDDIYDLWRERAKPKDSDVTFKAANALYRELNGDIAGGDFTTLKWAKVYVQIKAPSARAEIDRLEAESKFFRSLVVIALAFTAHFFLHERMPVVGIATLLLAALSYTRFQQQRWKMTELSYGTAVIVHAAAPPPSGNPQVEAASSD